MEIKIYTKEGHLRMTASADDNARATCGIQQESLLSLSFATFESVRLEVYDYVDFEGARYWVTEQYLPRMNDRHNWSYDLQLHGIEGLAAQTLMVNPTDGKDDPLVMLTAPAREHAALIVANLNRKMQTTDWKVGEVIVSEYLDIDYTGKYASDALSELSEAAGTEWWFDGMTLNISRCEYGEPIELSYGNGLIGDITPSAAAGVKFFTRLFPVGSTRNIDPDTYGHGRLQLPSGQTYVEQDTYMGIVEHYEEKAFSGIYPRRIGRVGSVRHEEKKGESGEPFTIYYFTDPDIPFDPNEHEIGGLVKQVTFQSGELRGRTFEVNYNTKKKEFEIITQWPYDDGQQLPAEPMVPVSGDEYVLWNIRMPESYYAAAEQEFLEAVDAFMAEHRKNVAEYRATTDFTVVERRGLDLKPGQRIRLKSDDYFSDAAASGYTDTRIVSISRSVVHPGTMDLTMSDVLAKGRISRIESDIVRVERMTREVSAEFPDLVRSWEGTPPSDATVFTSRAVDLRYLNRSRGGRIDGPVSFSARTTHDKGVQFGPDFIPGMTGLGGLIDGHGDGELGSLTLRRSLTVPVYNYNRVDMSVGDDWSAPGGGVIETLDATGQLATLRLEEGEIGTLRVGDICMGIFHSDTAADNATADSDDGRGNRTFAGFATCYFHVTEVLGDRYDRFRYEVRPASGRYPRPVAPMEMMSVVAYGSFTDPARRTSRYSTRTYERYLRGVSDWEFTKENIAAQFGDLANLSVFGMQMTGYSAYLDNIYMQGMLRSLDGTFVMDANTRSMLLASDKTGMGLSYNPEKGLVIGSVYDPQTGTFTKEHDIPRIEQLAEDAPAIAKKELLERLNDNTIFEVFEKIQMRAEWYSISGKTKADSPQGPGIYRDAVAKFGQENTDRVLGWHYNALDSYFANFDLWTDVDTHKGVDGSVFSKFYLARLLDTFYKELQYLTYSLTDEIDFLRKTFSSISTQIDGGVVLSGFMGVKNSKENVVAGMAGRNFLTNQEFSAEDESCPIFFAGATSIREANAAKTKIYPSGLLETSYIKATGGSIGDLIIDGLYLTSSHAKDHGCQLGESVFKSWGGDNEMVFSAIGSPVSASSPYTYFRAKIFDNNANVDHRAFEVLMNASSNYTKRLTAFYTDYGDIESFGGYISGQFVSRFSKTSLSPLYIGQQNFIGVQTFLVTAASTVYIPNPSYPDTKIRAGEYYDIISARDSVIAVQVRPYGSSVNIILPSGQPAASYALPARGHCRVIWDGSVWRLFI